MGKNLKRRDAVMLSHLQLAWEHAVSARLDPYTVVSKEKPAFEMLCSVDPSSGRYLAWISRLRRKDWKLEGVGTPVGLGDLRKLSDSLRAFAIMAPFLPDEDRDIGRHTSLEDLCLAVERGATTETARQARRLRERAQTVELFADSSGWKVISLRGPDAARRWGWGTKWCTTSSEATVELHLMTGALLVLVTPKGKFQLSTGTEEFRDAADCPADIVSVTADAPTAFLDAIEIAGRRLSHTALTQRLNSGTAASDLPQGKAVASGSKSFRPDVDGAENSHVDPEASKPIRPRTAAGWFARGSCK